MIKAYVPTIDGMRAIAISLVIASHFGVESFVPGGFGVTLFFFISGYLITGLMIWEEGTSGKIAIFPFYIRRFLRLGPALITMISIVSVVYYLLFGAVNGAQILAGLLYYTNLYVYPSFSALFPTTFPMPLWQLWSLSVEEHYYLIYPLFFAVAWKRHERFLVGLVVLTIAVLLWRIVLVDYWKVPGPRTYFATDTRIDSILYGALLAVLLNTRFAVIARYYFEHWAVVGAGAFMLLFTFLYREPTFRETFRYSLQGIALLPLFYGVLFTPRFSKARKILEIPAMIWIGKLSYSLYLYHVSVFVFVATLLPRANLIVVALVSVAASLGAASFSYYCVEKHFQKLRDRFRRGRTEDLPRTKGFNRSGQSLCNRSQTGAPR
jgi:peptidoglycan/LPS O-acetylase OafA/YrhL